MKEEEKALIIKKHEDGAVVCYGGADFIKAGNDLLRLDGLLMWDGLEEALGRLPQLEPEMVHTFSGGVYIREMHIPKGAFIVGKRHRHETCNVLLKGTLSLYLGDGKPVSKVTGPLIATSDPMVRKIAYCHEDSVFLNIHPTKETDLEKIESEFIITEQEFLETKGGQPCLGQP